MLKRKIIRKPYQEAIAFPGRATDYDEDVVLLHYVRSYQRHFLTDLEREVIWAVLTRSIAEEYADPQTALQALTAWGGLEDPLIQEALKDGPIAFRRRVKDRLLREHSDQMVINRCPRCSRIVRTPTAKLCLWCGHSWHPRPSPPPDSQASEPE